MLDIIWKELNYALWTVFNIYFLTVFTYFCSNLSLCGAACITETGPLHLLGWSKHNYKYVKYVYCIVKVFSYSQKTFVSEDN